MLVGSAHREQQTLIWGSERLWRPSEYNNGTHATADWLVDTVRVPVLPCLFDIR